MILTHSEEDLKLCSYDFELPPELIAKRPIGGRHNSKLLVYDQATDSITHDFFYNLANYLPTDSTLVMNQSKVFPCRLVGTKSTGGKCEVFLLTPIAKNGIFPVLIKTSSKKKIGDVYSFEAFLTCELVEAYEDGTFGVTFNRQDITGWLEKHGKVPIPPYIRGGDSDDQDKLDYQTIYAKETGSIAAPTAGLHFTDELFEKLESKNIEKAYVTLHVGLGTFAPVKVDDLKDHQMHTEAYKVSSVDQQKIVNAKKLFAVGTTSLRALESSCPDGKWQIEADQLKSTQIFLHPGKEVHSIDGLVTNFHLPKSTLLVLVSSLIGREKTLALYKDAIDKSYRFFSYGDAMLILRER